MTRNHSAALRTAHKSIIFIVFFGWHTMFGLAAGEKDRNTILKNEAAAVEMSRIWELDSVTQNTKSFEQIAKDWENLAEPQRAVFSLNETAKLAQINSDYETAFRALNKAIKLATDNRLIEEKIISLSLFSLISHQKGDKNNARKYSEQALSLSENSTSTQAKAFALFCRGMFEYYHGTINNATIYFEKANVYAQETQDIYLMSQTLFYVSFAYLREGNPYKAVDKMNLALQQSEQFNYQKGKALSYFGIAYVSFFLNEKQKALDFFKKADSLFPANFEWMEKARIVNAIGQIYMDFGELDLAETNFQQAVIYYERVNYPFGKIMTLTSLADVYLLKSDLQKAKQTYELAAKLSLEIDDKFRLANTKVGLGNIEFKENNFDTAIKNYLEALRTYNKIGVKLPITENLLGKAYEKKEDYKTARKFYNSALKITRKTKDFLQLSETLHNIANLDLIENELDQALNNIKESINLTENLYYDVANANLKSKYFSNVFDRYELYINLLIKRHSELPNENYAIQALQAAEKSRARSMLENLSFAGADFTKDASPELVKREKEIRVLLNSKADKLTDLLSNNADKSETGKLDSEINELNHELEEIKGSLKQNSPIYSAIKNPAPFNVDEFQQDVLDENSLLLEFSFGKEESYLWLVSKTEVNSYVLPPREQLESRIEKLRKLIDSRGMTEGETVENYRVRQNEAENDYKSESGQLSKELFGQIGDKLANKRLIIVPDGKLHYFPVAALPFPNSDEDQPFLLTNEIVYEPSAATLALLTQNNLKPSAPTKDLLIFSDPIFSGQDERIAAEFRNQTAPETGSAKIEKFRFVNSLSSLSRLNASQTEADSVRRIVGESASTAFTGAAATREQFLSETVSDYKIIHFATHGWLDEERPELSGIVLSQLNEKAETQNGVVRLHDIYGLNLAADLIVLSACETGLGKEVKGEGLLSLNNAFMQVGAKSVLSSLWKIDDYAAVELMEKFYQSLAAGEMTAAQALRQAQIKLRENPRYQSPFYWAAFTVQGDFQKPIVINKPFRFDYRWLFAVLFLIGALAFALKYRKKLLKI